MYYENVLRDFTPEPEPELFLVMITSLRVLLKRKYETFRIHFMVPCEDVFCSSIYEINYGQLLINTFRKVLFYQKVDCALFVNVKKLHFGGGMFLHYLILQKIVRACNAPSLPCPISDIAKNRKRKKTWTLQLAFDIY